VCVRAAPAPWVGGAPDGEADTARGACAGACRCLVGLGLCGRGGAAVDDDREEVVALLRAAGGAGLLEPNELAERTGAALTAKVAGELAPLTADLPPAWRERGRRESRRHERAGRAREELGGHVRAYVGVMVLLVGIWLSVALTGGGWYPWPVWPALGWGLGLASHARNARPHPARAL